MGMTPGKKRPERGAVTTPARAPDASASKKKPATAIAKADTQAGGARFQKIEKAADKTAKPDKAAKPKPADKIADKAGAQEEVAAGLVVARARIPPEAAGQRIDHVGRRRPSRG